MGTKVTLAELQAEAEGLYGDYEIELPGGKTLALRPMLRLSDEKQNKAYALQDRLIAMQNGTEKVDNFAAAARQLLHEVLRIVAVTKASADAFIRSHGSDLVLLMTIFNGYVKATQLGEAEGSPSSSASTAEPSSTT